MGAPRSIATAVRRSIDVARGNAGWSAAHDVTAVLAVKLARQLAVAEGTSDVVRLTRELRSVLATLPDGTPTPVAGEETAGGDDIDAELAAIVGSGPEMGDSTYP